MSDEPQTEDTMIAGLLRERDGYLLRGMADRAALVDEQLALRGYTPADDDQQGGGDEQGEQNPPPGGPQPKGRRAPRKAAT